MNLKKIMQAAVLGSTLLATNQNQVLAQNAKPQPQREVNSSVVGLGPIDLIAYRGTDELRVGSKVDAELVSSEVIKKDTKSKTN